MFVSRCLYRAISFSFLICLRFTEQTRGLAALGTKQREPAAHFVSSSPRGRRRVKEGNYMEAASHTGSTSYYDRGASSNSKYPPLFPLFRDQMAPVGNPIRQEILVPFSETSDSFMVLLHGVLSTEECKAIIAASEKRGYEAAEKFCWQYNDRYNDRLMSDDPQFSSFILERVKTYIPDLLHGHWRLKGLNDRWRYCRYFAGHYFGPHADGCWAPSRVERSGLTFMLYLNGPPEFSGGATTFLDIPRDRWAEDDFLKYAKVKFSVIPEPGMAIVFTQEDENLVHTGDKVTEGRKYILRTDVMYLLHQTD